MEAKDVRFKILIDNSETQLIKKFLYVTVDTGMCLVLKKYTCLKEKKFSLRLF